MTDIVANLIVINEKNKYLSKIPQPGMYPEFDAIVACGTSAIPILVQNMEWGSWTAISAILHIVPGEIKIPAEDRGVYDKIRAAIEQWYEKEFIHGTR